MGLEAASFIDDLVVTNPVAGDNVSQGDDHLRLLKTVTKATFPSLSRAIYLEQAPVDLASATTPDLSTPASNYINITGTTQIDGFATEPAGFLRWVRFAGILTLNYNGSSFILLSGDDIVTAAGDHALFISLGSGNWRMIMFQRAAGTALVAQVVPTASESTEGTVEQATDTEIFQAATGAKAIMAQDRSTAAAYVALSESGGSIAIDWKTFINGVVTIDENTAFANPTNEIPGDHHAILVKGNNSTGRTITFGTHFKGELPTVIDITSTRWYEFIIKCIDTDHFSVSAKRVL
jgi:hypothetical protein